MSYCKFWIYWVDVNTKFTIWQLTNRCHIVNFVFTPTQSIQNLQYDTNVPTHTWKQHGFFTPMHPIENKRTEGAYPVTWTPSWRLYSPCPQTNSTWAWLCPPPPPPQDLQAAQHCISSHIHCPHWRSQCRSKIVTLVKSQHWLIQYKKRMVLGEIKLHWRKQQVLFDSDENFIFHLKGIVSTSIYCLFKKLDSSIIPELYALTRIYTNSNH